MRFHDIDICGMSETQNPESLEDFYLNDVMCRGRILHNFRKGIHIKTIVIKHLKNVSFF